MLDSTCDLFSGVFKPFVFREMSFSMELVICVFGGVMVMVEGS